MWSNACTMALASVDRPLVTPSLDHSNPDETETGLKFRRDAQFV